MISEYFIDGIRGVSKADKKCNCLIVTSLLHSFLITVFNLEGFINDVSNNLYFWHFFLILHLNNY